MRGSDEVTGLLFSYVDLEERIPSRPGIRCARSDPSSTMRCVLWMESLTGSTPAKAALRLHRDG